ncbi:MAG: fluoride efflux transporter CrcB [Verrucomicrobiota bacterium JB023]|nr:fluoride efflux transporter CrcB [Verrucomicrobiota bacterium JB023]
MNALLVFLGGGLGALSRYYLSSFIIRAVPSRFPLGIFACNVLGCFLIGLGVGFAAKSAPSWFGPFALIGFLGGFTTFSTFANDSLSLMQAGRAELAWVNIIASIAVGLAAVACGVKLAQ